MTEVPIPPAERSDRHALVAQQARRLAELVRHIHGRNAFYTRKLDAAGIGPGDIDALDFPADLAKLPLTTRAELLADQAANPPWGTVLTEDISRYTRYNQTSSTTGRPLRWVDTNESWQWLLECWKAVYRGARVGPADRILFAFSFGPFLGFWTAFDAACQLGAHSIPAGAMSSQQRLALIDAVEPTALCCTPTYALRLAEVAEQEGRRPLSESSVRVVIVAGEPGGSIPSTRAHIERTWGARVLDHYGLTEVGPVSFECWEAGGFLHLNESQFIGEVLDPATLEAVADGQPGELVVTNLGRAASPVIRYRTGDLVVPRFDACPCGRTLTRFEGGIIARTDDMINIRGVNVYPSGIESVVRRFPEITEFRSTVSQSAALRTLSLEIELAPSVMDPRAVVTRLTQHLRESMALTLPIHVVAPGTLPRFEMKARRFVVET
jgi:phenylacetate-CoA ligase